MLKWISIGVGVITVLLIAFVIAASIYPGFREASRDIAVVIIAALWLVSSILTIAILFAILYAINAINRLAHDTIMPKIDTVTAKVNEVLDTTKTIAGNVRDASSTATTTTAYVAERVVSPVIRVSSLLAGVRATATALARRGSEPDMGEG